MESIPTTADAASHNSEDRCSSRMANRECNIIGDESIEEDVLLRCFPRLSELSKLDPFKSNTHKYGLLLGESLLTGQNEMDSISTRRSDRLSAEKYRWVASTVRDRTPIVCGVVLCGLIVTWRVGYIKSKYLFNSVSFLLAGGLFIFLEAFLLEKHFRNAAKRFSDPGGGLSKREIIPSDYDFEAWGCIDDQKLDLLSEEECTDMSFTLFTFGAHYRKIKPHDLLRLVIHGHIPLKAYASIKVCIAMVQDWTENLKNRDQIRSEQVENLLNNWRWEAVRPVYDKLNDEDKKSYRLIIAHLPRHCNFGGGWKFE